MKEILGEFLGTLLLVLLGNGVVAGVVLPKTKNNNAGWVAITLGWGIAVTIAAAISGKLGPAHLNPAVTVAFLMNGDIALGTAMTYIAAQVIGAMTGSLLVWLQFKPHYDVTEDQGAILGTFATGPALRNTVSNVLSEVFGTFVLVLAILAFGLYQMPDGVGVITVGLLVIGIGLSLGGTTGYAINPARDLGPRLLHAILPIKHKGDSDWAYAWVPVVGPIVGAVLATIIFKAFF